MEIAIGRRIRTLRREREISQEILASAVGVSVQAVSKWETDQSLPDIAIIPAIARFLGVGIDDLFYENDIKKVNMNLIPNDGKLYIVQVRNGEILGHDTWEEHNHILLKLMPKENNISVEAWGSIDIQGDVNGCVSAGDNVSCEDVGGSVSAGDSVSCEDVGGSVSAGDSVSCGDVGGSVNAGDSVSCGDINGSGSINCPTLYAKGAVSCNTIRGEVHSCEDISFDL